MQAEPTPPRLRQPEYFGFTQRHKVIVDRFGMPRLVEAIEKVGYPTIDLQAVRWPARGGVARMDAEAS